jgi:nucleoside-diphosphate-sugar epimerase
MIALLQRAANGEYNISSAQPTRIDEVVQGLAHLLDADAQPILSLTANFPSEPPLLVGDNARLMALGWTPQYALREGLQRTLDDLRASPAGT